ncbi:MAG: tRNA 2-thiouridine(34) synthase MnmA [Desulfofustis sp.]|nr:tRNA 2-thiouridine(34) synthase MnmA [Desulfofustis sp.]
MKRIGLAMSGGVDSTASALILKEHYKVSGFLMDIGQPCFSEQVEEVETIAGRLGIDLQIVDLKVRFKEIVLDYFIDSYKEGKTPNPCMICNREIKCGLFLEHILSNGLEAMATGHYVQRREMDGYPALYRGIDHHKDQSYFLARLSLEQLGRLRFPLGAMRKEQTYAFMEAHGFNDFRGKESQDVCFLKDMKVSEFLDDELDSSIMAGPIVTVDGEQIGRHQGLHRYTVGQRRGLGLPDHTPWYVCALDAGANRLIVGKNEHLNTRVLKAVAPHWLVPSPPECGERFTVKIRSTHSGTMATITEIDGSHIAVEFDQLQRAISPGQFAVLYNNNQVIGSAEIIAS